MTPTRIIVAGSRDITDYEEVVEAINDGLDAFGLKSAASVDPSEVEIVSGHARGVDRLAELWAHRVGIPVKTFPADWNSYGKRAGHLRNVQMAEYANALIAIWDGISRGTRDMIHEACDHGLLVYAHFVPADPKTYPRELGDLDNPEAFREIIDQIADRRNCHIQMSPALTASVTGTFFQFPDVSMIDCVTPEVPAPVAPAVVLRPALSYTESLREPRGRFAIPKRATKRST